MKDVRNVIYLSLIAGMLIYAVPRMEIGQGLTVSTVFGLVWIAFALIAVAAHLHQILGVDEETAKELSKIKRMKKWQLEQMLSGKRKMFK